MARKKTDSGDASPNIDSIPELVLPSDQETQKIPVPMSMHSDLHPEKLNFTRFSERKQSLDDDRITVGRLVLYIVLVVAVGVGLTFLVQTYIRSQNSTPTDNAKAPTVSTPVSLPVINVNRDVIPDTQATPSLPADSAFSVNATTTKGTRPDSVKSIFNGLNYQRYTSVERVTVKLDESNTATVLTNLAYDKAAKTITLELPNITTTESDLKPGKQLVSLGSGTTTVTSIDNTSANSDTTKLTIRLSETVKYVLNSDSDSIWLDIRQEDYQASGAPTTPTTPTTPVADGEKPAAPFYDNSYSKNTQYISSSYTGNKLRVWNYTYRDYGDRYEFKFRIKDDGSGVSPMKPNTKAYLNTDTANPTLTVEISNINWEILANSKDGDKDKDGCFDNVGYGNVKKICGNFEADKNMVTYTIHLNKRADFEVDSIENSTVDESRPGEVIWVKIKDN